MSGDNFFNSVSPLFQNVLRDKLRPASASYMLNLLQDPSSGGNFREFLGNTGVQGLLNSDIGQQLQDAIGGGLFPKVGQSLGDFGASGGPMGGLRSKILGDEGFIGNLFRQIAGQGVNPTLNNYTNQAFGQGLRQWEDQDPITPLINQIVDRDWNVFGGAGGG